MRLLDTKTGQFVQRDPAKTKYAILSHTWDKDGEQTYKELEKIQQRYPLESQVPQSLPSGLGNVTSSLSERERTGPQSTPGRSQPSRDSPSATPPLQKISSPPEQDRSEPSPIPSPSQPPRDSPPATPSRPSKPWFARGMRQLKRWWQRRSTRNAHQIQIDSGAGAVTPSVHPSSTPNDPSAQPANDPPPTSGDPSAPSPDRLPKAPQTIWDDPDLSPKIRNACKVAHENGYHYIWIDSCCIDKSSSSELSEAISSMYQWYGLAAMCYAYLVDVLPRDDHHANRSSFRRSRWFKRGWTLQELIAPINMVFLFNDWTPIGSKHALNGLVESITKIGCKALLHLEPLSSFSVAQRLSWAAERETERKEDRAYSLLGIFDITMPTLYGEGDRAFRRLQEQIMLRIPDQSLLAWGTIHLPDSRLTLSTPSPSAFRAEMQDVHRRSPLAQVVYNFKDSNEVKLPTSRRERIEYTSTPYGIRTELQMIPLTRDLLSHILGHSEVVELQLPDKYRWYLAILGCEHAKYGTHLLGRVYAIRPSESGIDSVYTARVRPNLAPQSRSSDPLPDLFLLSPDIIKHYSSTERKMVHIPHPDHADQTLDLRDRPYLAIKLALLEDTSHALRFQGYSVDLRDPDVGHPTTHWLTLSNLEGRHTITIEFNHALEDDGKRFTIRAEVTLGSRSQPDSTPSADQVDCRTMSWSDRSPWETRLQKESVRLEAVGVPLLTVDLDLQFVGTGFYVIGIIVHTGESASSAAGSGVRSIMAARGIFSFLDGALWGH